MKKCLFGFCLLFSQASFAQSFADPPLTMDSIAVASDTLPADRAGSSPDTAFSNMPHNSYGDLLNDDPRYNPRYPWTLVLGRVAAANAFNWALCRYMFHFDWARINPQTWKDNLEYKWEWDVDRFGVNFIGHPHSGSNYFNVARSNGYSFFASYPFAIAGSFMWEYFGENTRPSKNDLVNTPVSGAFLGEVLYRVSSNILDESKRGRERVWREIFAGLINPTRALNRLTQKKMFRVTPVDVYQNEPLDVILSAGMHKVNVNNKFGSGNTNAIFNLHMEYGDPFEMRRRKPFDVFSLKLEGRYGDDKKIIDNVVGYGLLFGKNTGKGNRGMLLGIFQHFDYWNNKVFELGSLGFGPGIISRIVLARDLDLFSSLHIAGVPMAGNSTRFGPDTSVFRDYPFGGGWEGRIEERLNLSRWVTLGFTGYYYRIYNYEGSKGKSHIGILKPMISIRIAGNMRLGMEHHIYYDNRFLDKESSLHLTRTEQKIFLQFFFIDKRGGGRFR